MKESTNRRLVSVKRIITLIGITCAFSSTVAPQHQHPSPTPTRPIALISGLGSHHHPVSTKNPEAQRFFDQGLALAYAFNHEEAVRSFKRAAELDPELAMAYWGIALALGPNINMPIDAERMKAAYEAVQKALSPASKANEKERGYIEALSKRYSADPKADIKTLEVAYKNAMGELSRRYPDDLDAATLYAESLMDLRPWQLWSSDGKPAEGTEEVIAVLESVLRRDPDHIGANHYYIHAVEAGPEPERALPSAQRLKALAPAAGHLVHMPAHIDMRTGNYEAAARSNAYAADADRRHFQSFGRYGMYPVMYYSHNLHFLAMAHAMQGRYADAKRAALQLDGHLNTYVSDSSTPDSMLAMLEVFAPTTMLVEVRFRRWTELSKAPAPSPKLPITTALWRFARGMAYASSGQSDLADGELKHLSTVQQSLSPQTTYGLSSASSILSIAEHLLRARIAVVKNDKNAAIALLRKAVELEDSLAYNEPPDWPIPARESLGSALIVNGDYAEAEKVFRDDQSKNPRSGRSLFGLLESLKRQGKNLAVPFIQRQFEAAWKNADTQLKIEDL
jgi:tetratricopeptide (TPR) repeat protein